MDPITKDTLYSFIKVTAVETSIEVVVIDYTLLNQSPEIVDQILRLPASFSGFRKYIIPSDDF